LAERYDVVSHRSQGLVDVLDRILDKGLVIAGDIKVNLANVELLTIRIRLLVCSIDKAEEIGMNWWRTDPSFATPVPHAADLEGVIQRLDSIQTRLNALEGKPVVPPTHSTER
jgi:hypothetical protein